MGFFDFIGNAIGGLVGAHTAEKNREMQTKFAKKGIQWRVDDAKKAGINPYYALGAQTSSYSPVSTGDVSTSLSNMGADIDRSIDATKTHSERQLTFDNKVRSLTVDKMQLENKILAADLAKKTAQVGPALPSPSQRWLVDGQGSAPYVSNVPLKRVVSNPGQPSSEPGPVSDIGYTRTKTGMFPVNSEDAMKRMSNDLVGEALWSFRNRVLPTVGFNQNPPNAPLPKGYDAWQWNPITFQYEPMREPKWMGRFGKYFRY